MRWTLSVVMTLSLTAVPVLAEQHIVSRGELQQRLRGAAAKRDGNLAQLERVMGKPEVRAALQTAKIDAGSVTRAAALLSDDELARLSARAAQLESDIAAGALTNQQLTYIVIALATAVIVIVLS